jgi:hypothetical protein
MPEGPIRQDTRSVMVTIFRPGTDIPIIKGVWDKKSGGQMDSEETTYHPGGMADPVSLGGRKNVENLCRIGRDWAAIPSLMNAVGKAKVTVTDQPLDFDGNASGINALTYNGTLKRVTPPDADSEASGPAMIEIEVTVDGYPS